MPRVLFFCKEYFMKKILFGIFTWFDIALWSMSVIAISLAFGLAGSRDYFALASSLTGVTMLNFIAKGHVAGMFLTVAFSVLYGIISYFFGYYGEMITYLGMSTPAAVVAIVTWLRHPYKDSKEVAVGSLNGKKIAMIAVSCTAVTVVFYFILRALGTTNLIVSTVSVTTSFAASALTMLRSPLYGFAYSCNDIVLIVMWILATVDDIKYVPMVICFALFLIYDIYGSVNWIIMKRRQANTK